MTKKPNETPENPTYNIQAEVATVGQSGGQAAKTIYNIGQQKRTLQICDTCYDKFLKRKERLKNNINKLYREHHIDCPVMDF